MEKPAIAADAKIELRAIKYAAFASEETSCFEAKVYLDGLFVAVVSNEGRGGCNMWHTKAPGIEEKLTAWAKANEPVEYLNAEYKANNDPMDRDADSLVDRLLTEWLVLRDMRRAFKTKLLFTKADKPGLYETTSIKAPMMAKLADPANRAAMVPNIPHDRILNWMPEAEALKVYLANGKREF